MAMATTWGMATVMRWQATKKATARAARAMATAIGMAGDKEGDGKAARAMATAMKVAGNKESDGKNGKGNSNCNEDDKQQREQWQGWQKQWQQ